MGTTDVYMRVLGLRAELARAYEEGRLSSDTGHDVDQAYREAAQALFHAERALWEIQETPPSHSDVKIHEQTTSLHADEATEQ